MLLRKGDLVGLFHAFFEGELGTVPIPSPDDGDVMLLSTVARASFVKYVVPSLPHALPKSSELRVPPIFPIPLGELPSALLLYIRSFARCAVARLGPVLLGSQWEGSDLRGLCPDPGWLP